MENGKIKTDKSKKAYSIIYFAINGQDISEIKENKITTLSSKIYVNLK